MTSADLQRAAKNWLDDDRRVTLRYRDESLRPRATAATAPPTYPEWVSTVPPASQPPVVIASEGAREARPGPAEALPRLRPY